MLTASAVPYRRGKGSKFTDVTSVNEISLPSPFAWLLCQTNEMGVGVLNKDVV